MSRLVSAAACAGADGGGRFRVVRWLVPSTCARSRMARPARRSGLYWSDGVRLPSPPGWFSSATAWAATTSARSEMVDGPFSVFWGRRFIDRAPMIRIEHDDVPRSGRRRRTGSASAAGSAARWASLRRRPGHGNKDRGSMCRSWHRRVAKRSPAGRAARPTGAIGCRVPRSSTATSRRLSRLAAPTNV